VRAAHQRTEFRGRVTRIADDQRGRRLGERLGDPPVDAGGGDHPAGGGAVLAGVAVSGGPHARRHRVDVGVVEHHDRRLAAEFEVQPFERRCRGRRDGPAGAHRSGDRHHVDARMPGERCTEPAVAGDDREHSGRQRRGGEVGQAQGAQRGEFRRLEDDRAAGRDRRTELPHGHHQRVVPRRDRRDHTDRLAPDHRRGPGDVLPGGRRGEAPGGAGEEPEVVDREVDLLRGGGDRLADVA
jgi:ParB family chromosome partitioning protein